MLLRKGSLLLEVMVALFMGSLLITLLVQSTAQLGKIFKKITIISERDRMFCVIQQRLEVDLSGLIYPQISINEEKARDSLDQEKEQESSSEEQKRKEKEQKKAEMRKKGQQEEKKDNELPYAFYSTLDEAKNCSLLTFITTNPLESYADPIARLVRVVYRLQPDPEHHGLLMLVRQQSDDLDFKRFAPDAPTKIRPYTVADRVVSFSVEFYIPKPQPEEADKKDESHDKKAKKNEDDQEKKREWITLTEWEEVLPEQVKKQKTKERRPSLPSFINIKIVLQDAQDRSFSYELWNAPFYGINAYYVEGITTLPSKQEYYHHKFAEYRSKEHHEFAHAQKMAQEARKQL